MNKLIISNEPVDLVNRLQIALFIGESDLTLNVCTIYGAKSSSQKRKYKAVNGEVPVLFYFSECETRTLYFIF